MLKAVSGFIISRRILAAWGRLPETGFALGTGIRGDPNLPFADVRPLEEVVRRPLSPQRFNVILLKAFSGLALLLATTGIYGVPSYAMNQRTAEVGLRVALGASPTNILDIALGQGMRPAVVGMLLRAHGAWRLWHYLETLLFGINPFDSVTYVMCPRSCWPRLSSLACCPVAAPCGSVQQLRLAQIEHSVKMPSQIFDGIGPGKR